MAPLSLSRLLQASSVPDHEVGDECGEAGDDDADDHSPDVVAEDVDVDVHHLGACRPHEEAVVEEGARPDQGQGPARGGRRGGLRFLEG